MFHEICDILPARGPFLRELGEKLNNQDIFAPNLAIIFIYPVNFWVVAIRPSA